MRITESVNTVGKWNDGHIEGLKLLGWVSKNGRRYNQEAVNKIANRYLNRPLYVNHAEQGKARKVEDIWGTIDEIDVRADGLYSNCSVIKSHEMSPRVQECCERPELNRCLGMSHSVMGKTREVEIDGKTVDEVYEIDDVIDVSLVADPATTTGLFEQTGGVIFEQTEHVEEEKEEEEEIKLVLCPHCGMDINAPKVEQTISDETKTLLERVNKLEEELKNKNVVKTSYIRSEPTVVEQTASKKPLKSYFEE